MTSTSLSMLLCDDRVKRVEMIESAGVKNIMILEV